MKLLNTLNIQVRSTKRCPQTVMGETNSGTFLQFDISFKKLLSLKAVISIRGLATVLWMADCHVCDDCSSPVGLTKEHKCFDHEMCQMYDWWEMLQQWVQALSLWDISESQHTARTRTHCKKCISISFFFKSWFQLRFFSLTLMQISFLK